MTVYVSDRWNVLCVQSIADSFLDEPARAIEGAKRQEHQSEIYLCRTGHILAEAVGDFGIVHIVIDSECLLQMLSRSNKITLKPARHAGNSVGDCGLGRFRLARN